MKRFIDLIVSLIGLIIVSPLLLMVTFLVWRHDRHSPFYIATRVGKNGRLFNMVKLRSMVVNADKSGVDSTSSNDSRITPVGHFIRNYKLDELTQLWNVILGDMSLVGPRPNVKSETDLYTDVEKLLLSVRPGITDFSSIVFSDEAEILANKKDPDLSYNQLIRPWKSRLGIVYIENQTILLDLGLILYTAIAIISKKKALSWVIGQLTYLNANEELITASKRVEELYPSSPPGSSEIVTER
jgi:lipopolysaccharide/colanic/teichoic acid biosynthesis glycosyltransferase